MGFSVKFIDRTSTASTSGVNYTPNSSTSQGTFLVMIIGTGSSAHVTSVTDDTPSNLWSLDVVGTNGNRNICIASSQCVNALTTSNTITVTSSVSGGSQTLLGFAYTLVDNTIYLNAQVYDKRSGAFANTSSGPLSTGSTGTLSFASELAVTGIVSSTSETYTGPGGYTTRTSTANTSSGADQITSSTTALNPSWSWNNSANTAVGIATYKMALAPTVSSSAGTSVTGTSFTANGNATADNGDSITDRGIVWATSSNPAIGGGGVTQLSSGSGTGTITKSITGLIAGTTYHYRAYAINGVGTSYSSDQAVTTDNVPSVTTNAASAVSYTSATGNGSVDSDNGDTDTVRGFCWDTNANPVASGNHVTSSSGVGSYNASMSPLLPNTTYHYRAYATNTVGTGYGADTTFTTLDVPLQLATLGVG